MQVRSTTKAVAEKELTAEDLEYFRRLLLEKRAEIHELLRHDVKAGQSSNDESFDDSIDRANNAFSRELNFSLSDAERETILLIDEALDRMTRNQFGICIACGTRIQRQRLEAVPWTRYCIECQEKVEAGLMAG
ncbi:MAG: TraR/DksA family transcriptional regulator [Acidobacteriota bacterium]